MGAAVVDRTGRGRAAGRRARQGDRAVTGGTAALALAAVVALGGCGAAPSSSSAPAPGATTAAVAAPASADEFWSALRLEGAETDRTDTLEALAARADAVVQGRISDLAFSRTVGDTPEEAMSYGLVTVQVDRVLRGATAASTVPVELVLPVPPDESPEAFTARVAAQRPAEPVVAFVRAKTGAADQGRFRLVNLGGLWTAGSPGLATPLSVPTPGERFGASVAGLSTLDDLMTRVQGIPPTGGPASSGGSPSA